MELVKTVLRDRRFHRLALVGTVVGAGCVLAAWKAGVDAAMVKAWWKLAEDYLQHRPWLLFAVLVVLPGLPVPTSALMLLAGTVWRDRPVAACAICLLAIALNLTWTYWAAARPGRGLVEKWLAASEFKIPEVGKGNHLRLLLLLRLTPGVPLFFQNYLLGFLRVPFALYLPVSLACTGVVASGVVLSGAGIAGGNLKPLMTGVGLIVVGVVAVQMLRQKMQGKVPGER